MPDEDLLDALLTGSSDEVCVTVGGVRLSRSELLTWACAVAADLRGADVVAVHASPTAQTVVAVVAGLLAGVPIVPLPPDAGPIERSHMLRDSGATLVLSDDPEMVGDAATSGHAGSAARVVLGDRVARPPVVPVTRSARSIRSATFAPPTSAGATGAGVGEPCPERAALIVYTSGTTGLPKGVVLSRGAVAANLDALVDAWRWTPADTLVHGLPLFHVHGLVLGVLGALRVGSPLVHTGRPTPAAYAAAAGTLYFGVPTVWSRVRADPGAARALRRARLLVSGSAPLPATVFDALTALTGHRPVERYGMTETLITVSARADGDRRPRCVGVPVSGVETRLVGEHGEPVPADGGSPGELLVRGATLFDGYLRGGETVPATDADGWFATGDIAMIERDGTHRIVGRASTDLIKTGGYRVGAGEVEDALLAHPAVREAAVVGTPHDDLGEQITAYVVADGVRPQDLIDFVATSLSTHKRPRRVYLVDRLPRNPMGKVLKKLLADPYPRQS